MFDLLKFLATRNWWGKILGAIFGYMVARSIGALIGILIGNIFDRAIAHQASNPFSIFGQGINQNVQMIFLETTFTVMGYIAKSDGRVSEKEIQTAKMLMNTIRLNKKQKKLAQEFFNQGKSNPTHMDSILQTFKQTCRFNRNLLQTFANIQYAMAQVDGLTDKKIVALNKIFITLDLAPLSRQQRFYDDFDYYTSSNRNYDNRYQSSGRYQNYQTSSLDQAHSILGTKPTDNEATVKKAYRRLISQNHPDKLIAKGASEAELKIANNKTQAIRKAYEQICASKGW